MTNVNDPRIHYRTAGGWIDVGTGAFTAVEFPTATNVGIDALDGWTPASTVGSPESLEFVQFGEPGGVLQDIRIHGGLAITGPHITLRRVDIVGGGLDNTYGNQIGNDLVMEDCTVRLDPPGVNTDFTLGFPAVGNTGMLMRRCSIIDHTEGLRIGGSGYPLRDPLYTTNAYRTRIYNCYIRITGPQPCSPEQGIDYHGDGMQAFDGGMAGVGLTIRNCTIRSVDQPTTPGIPGEFACGGTSCMICGATQAQPFNVDGLLMSGAAYSFVCENGGIYKNMYFEEDTSIFGPVSVPAEGWAVTDEEQWSAYICTLDVNGQPDVITASIPHGWPGFGPLDPPP